MCSTVFPSGAKMMYTPRSLGASNGARGAGKGTRGAALRDLYKSRILARIFFCSAYVSISPRQSAARELQNIGNPPPCCDKYAGLGGYYFRPRNTCAILTRSITNRHFNVACKSPKAGAWHVAAFSSFLLHSAATPLAVAPDKSLILKA